MSTTKVTISQIFIIYKANWNHRPYAVATPVIFYFYCQLSILKIVLWRKSLVVARVASYLNDCNILQRFQFDKYSAKIFVAILLRNLPCCHGNKCNSLFYYLCDIKTKCCLACAIKHFAHVALLKYSVRSEQTGDFVICKRCASYLFLCKLKWYLLCWIQGN